MVRGVETRSASSLYSEGEKRNGPNRFSRVGRASRHWGFYLFRGAGRYNFRCGCILDRAAGGRAAAPAKLVPSSHKNAPYKYYVNYAENPEISYGRKTAGTAVTRIGYGRKRARRAVPVLLPSAEPRRLRCVQAMRRGNNPMTPAYSTRRLQRPTLSVVACRPSTHRVGVKGNVRLRSHLRLVPDRVPYSTDSKPQLGLESARHARGYNGAALAPRTLECNTCGREVVRREPGRKICPRCESYWTIVELVTMGRVNS